MSWFFEKKEEKVVEEVPVPAPTPPVVTESTIHDDKWGSGPHGVVNNASHGWKFWRYLPNLRLPAPGQFEALHDPSKEVFSDQDVFDGLKIEYFKAISDRFTMNHSLTMGASEEEAKYSLFSFFSPTDDTYFLTRFDTEGSVFGRAGKSFGGSRASVQVSSGEHSGFALDWEYGHPAINDPQPSIPKFGGGYNIFTRYVHPGQLQLSYLQSVSQNLALGVDWVHAQQQAISAFTFGGRWASKNHQFAASIVPLSASANLSATRKLWAKPGKDEFTPLVLATEMQAQLQPQSVEMETSVGAKWTTSDQKSSLRAMVTSKGHLVVTYSEAFAVMQGSVVGDVDFKKGTYKFGLGLKFEIQPPPRQQEQEHGHDE